MKLLIIMLATLMSATQVNAQWYYEGVTRVLIKDDNTAIVQLSSESGKIVPIPKKDSTGETIALTMCIIAEGGDTVKVEVRNTIDITSVSNIYTAIDGKDQFLLKEDSITWMKRKKVLDTYRVKENWTYKFRLKERIKRT